MLREYRHISQYAKEIYELRNKGLTLNEIEKKLGFTHSLYGLLQQCLA